jgi:hypothetical protein
MKISPLFIFLVILLVLSNCDAPGLVVEVDPLLELIAPDREVDQEYCCTDFRWESDSALSDHSFMLSTDAAFDSIIIDSSGLVNSFQLDLNLGTDKSYYWKIKCTSTGLERTSSFKIIDYISRYEGTFPAIYHEVSWNGLQGVTLDTTYAGEITMSKDDIEDHLHLEYESLTKKKAFDYRIFPEITSTGKIKFLDDIEEFPRLTITGSIDVVSDSLAFFYHSFPNSGDYKLKINASLK